MSNRFTGQIYDDDTGLYYYGSRYYDAELGRFIQADSVIPGGPTSGSQALNRYSYTFNNPLKFTDPDGQSPVLDYSVAIFSAINNVGAAGAEAQSYQNGDSVVQDPNNADSGLGPASGNRRVQAEREYRKDRITQIQENHNNVFQNSSNKNGPSTLTDSEQGSVPAGFDKALPIAGLDSYDPFGLTPEVYQQLDRKRQREMLLAKHHVENKLFDTDFAKKEAFIEGFEEGYDAAYDTLGKGIYNWSPLRGSAIAFSTPSTVAIPGVPATSGGAKGGWSIDQGWLANIGGDFGTSKMKVAYRFGLNEDGRTHSFRYKYKISNKLNIGINDKTTNVSLGYDYVKIQLIFAVPPALLGNGYE